MGDYVRVAGVETYVDIRGEGAPVLLLHGGLMSGDDYPDLRAALAERFRMISPDRRGQGHTRDDDEPLTYDLMAADTVAVLDALGIERAHVVGHSDGAILGMLLGRHHADRVERLVLISGNAWVDAVRADVRDYLANSGDEEWADMEAEWRRYTPDPPERWPVVLRKVRRLFLTEPTMTEADLAEIATPTLILGGDRDFVPVDHLEMQHRAIRGSRLGIVPGAGHQLTTTHAGLLAGWISEFLSGA